MNRSILLFVIVFVFSFYAYAQIAPESTVYVNREAARLACNSMRGSGSCSQFNYGLPPGFGSYAFKVQFTPARELPPFTSGTYLDCPSFASSCEFHFFEYLLDESGCPSGTEPDSNGQCQEPEPEPEPVSCEAGSEVWLTFDNWYLPGTTCASDGCSYSLGATSIIGSSGYTQGMYRNTGEECDGSEGQNTITGGGTPEPPEPTNNCPSGYVESSMGCVAVAPDEEPPVNCPVGYFPDAAGTCWRDIDGTETGDPKPDQMPKPTGPYTGGPTSTAPGSDGGSQGSGGGTQTGGNYEPGTGPQPGPPGAPGAAGGNPGQGSGNDEGTGQGSGAASKSCEQAPSSQGDAQLDAILRQQWETMCKGHNAKVQGTGDCHSEFKCDGDPMMCINLEYQRMTACSSRDSDLAIEGADNELSGRGFRTMEQVEADREASGYERDTEIDVKDEMDIYAGETTGSCPADISLNVLNATVEIPLSRFCQLFGWVGIFVRIAASLTSFFMIFNTLREI
ncbi:hypothetical protein [Phage toucan80]|nr:hypothetical protein [Phage toucan80]